MKAVVLGSAGMLGSDLLPVWSGRAVVRAFPREACDISDKAAVNSVLRSEKPDVVLLLAAATDVDRCQLDHAYAYRANAVGAEIVSQACRSAGSSLVYISTIAVFNGEKASPYDEYDIPSPINVYGLSKYHGESAVRTFCPEHWIVRTGWLFGGGSRDTKFVARILRKTALEEKISVVRDCVGSPTYTADLAEGLLRLVSSFQHGTYHMVNSGSPASRYELAREALEIAGYPAEMVLPCLSSDFDLPAPRPKMEAACTVKLAFEDSRLALPDWKESLSSYIRGTLSGMMR